MRCACTLACSAEWMATGHRGAGKNIVLYSCEKGNVCSYLSEDCFGGKWREDEKKSMTCPLEWHEERKQKIER